MYRMKGSDYDRWTPRHAPLPSEAAGELMS